MIKVYRIIDKNSGKPISKDFYTKKEVLRRFESIAIYGDCEDEIEIQKSEAPLDIEGFEKLWRAFVFGDYRFVKALWDFLPIETKQAFIDQKAQELLR